MTGRIARTAALIAAVSVAGSILVAAPASATETPGPLVTVTVRPVDPQPIVPGHEGDILLQVNVAMAGTAAPAAKKAKVVTTVKAVKAAARKAAR